MRLFFALWPPAETAAALAGWARKVQTLTGGRALPEQSIHVTLAFLGNVGDERMPAALRAARRVQASAAMLPIEEARRWSDHELVWVGPLRTPPKLASLAQSLRTELGKEAFQIESRPFVVHVTMVRKARNAAPLPPLPRVEWPVTEFTLVHSTLSRHGSSYRIVHRTAIA